MFTRSGSWLICRKGDALGTPSVTRCSQEAFRLPLLIVLAELPARVYSKESIFHSPSGSLDPLESAIGHFCNRPPPGWKTRGPFLNVRWPRPVFIKFSSIAFLGTWSPGKRLALNFSGTLLICPPKGFSYVVRVLWLWRRPSRWKF